MENKLKVIIIFCNTGFVRHISIIS